MSQLRFASKMMRGRVKEEASAAAMKVNRFSLSPPFSVRFESCLRYQVAIERGAVKLSGRRLLGWVVMEYHDNGYTRCFFNFIPFISPAEKEREKTFAEKRAGKITDLSLFTRARTLLRRWADQIAVGSRRKFPRYRNRGNMVDLILAEFRHWTPDEKLEMIMWCTRFLENFF